MRAHLTVFPMGRDQVMVEATCPKCKDIHAFVASFRGLEAWENGELIQRALPTLTVEQREMLMTGYCQKCWDEVFAIEETEADADADEN